MHVIQFPAVFDQHAEYLSHELKALEDITESNVPPPDAERPIKALAFWVQYLIPLGTAYAQHVRQAAPRLAQVLIDAKRFENPFGALTNQQSIKLPIRILGRARARFPQQLTAQLDKLVGKRFSSFTGFAQCSHQIPGCIGG